MDMSKAFVKGAGDELPNAKITFDRFHVMKLANAAVDQTRRAEVKTNAFLKRTRYAWLKNPKNLTDKQRDLIEQPELLHTRTAKAYQLKLALADFYNVPRGLAKGELTRLAKRMRESGIPAIARLGETLLVWKKNILGYFRSRLTTGYMEGINSLVQAAKAKARGYAAKRNFITIIYLIAGRLPLPTRPFTTH